MNPRTERRAVAGPAGSLECAIDAPAHGSGRGLAVLCHPHPLHGGTLDNKIVQTLARTCLLYTSPSPRDRTRSRMPSSA